MKLSESGKGDHKVDVCYAAIHVARDVPVYNAEVTELPEEPAALPIRRVTRH